MLLLIQEEFEDTKGVIRIKKSEKVQTTYSDQKKKYKKTHTKKDQQNIHIKLKIE
jgi:hypothetical protein